MLNLKKIDKIDRLDKVVDMLGSLDSLNHSVGVVGVMVGVAAGVREGCKTTSIHSYRYLCRRAEANQKTGMPCSSSRGICVLCSSAMEIAGRSQQHDHCESCCQLKRPFAL